MATREGADAAGRRRRFRRSAVLNRVFRSGIFLGALATALFVVTWIVGDGIVTSGRLIRLINDNTDDVHVNYSSCTGSMLTRYVFHDLAVDGQDSAVKWSIRMKRAELTPSIWRLPMRKFYTGILHATGFSFRLSFKPKQEGPEDPNSYKDNWRLRFGDIDFREISEITVGEVSYKGKGTAQLKSGFYYWPEREIEIGPTTLRTHEEIFDMNLRFSTERLLFKDYPGFTFLRGVTADLDFKGKTQDLGFLNYYFRSVPWLRIGGRRNHLEISGGMRKGVVTRSTRALFKVEDLRLRAGRFSAVGRGRVEFSDYKLSARFRDYALQPLDLRGDRFDFLAVAKTLDLADPLADLDLFFDVSQVRVVKLAGVNRLMERPKGVRILGGSARVQSKLKYETRGKKLTGNLEVDALKLRLKIAGSEIETDARLTAKLAAGVPGEESVATLDLTKLRIASESSRGFAQVDRWWGRAKLVDPDLSLEPGQGVSGRVSLKSRDGEPFLYALLNSGSVPNDLTTLSSLRDLKATADLRLDPKSARIRDFTLKSATVDAKGDAVFKNGEKHGKLEIEHPLKDFEVKLGD